MQKPAEEMNHSHIHYRDNEILTISDIVFSISVFWFSLETSKMMKFLFLILLLEVDIAVLLTDKENIFEKTSIYAKFFNSKSENVFKINMIFGDPKSMMAASLTSKISDNRKTFVISKIGSISSLEDLGTDGLTIVMIKNSDIHTLLSEFDNLVQIEIDNISCRFWDQSRQIFIILDNLDEIEKFTSNKYFRRHSNIRLLTHQKAYRNKSLISQANFDVWKSKWQYSSIDVDSQQHKAFLPNQQFDFMKYEV